jgi:hypothetical protein
VHQGTGALSHHITGSSKIASTTHPVAGGFFFLRWGTTAIPLDNASGGVESSRQWASKQQPPS